LGDELQTGSLSFGRAPDPPSQKVFLNAIHFQHSATV